MEADIKVLVKCLAEIIETYEFLSASKQREEKPKLKKENN